MALSKRAQAHGGHPCVLLQKLMDPRISVSITGILIIISLFEKHGLCPISSLISIQLLLLLLLIHTFSVLSLQLKKLR